MEETTSFGEVPLALAAFVDLVGASGDAAGGMKGGAVALDGAVAARFLQELKRLLEEPFGLLL